MKFIIRDGEYLSSDTVTAFQKERFVLGIWKLNLLIQPHCWRQFLQFIKLFRTKNDKFK